MRASLVIFGVNVLLWVVQSQLNHYAATWHLTFVAMGLCIAFCALRLGFKEGVRALVLTGLWVDAATPVPFGMSAFLFVFVHLVVFGVRGRLPRDEALIGVIIAALANLGILIVTSAMLLSRNPEPLEMAGRILADSLASFALILLIGPWFFALCEHVLAICGVSLRRDHRGIA